MNLQFRRTLPTHIEYPPQYILFTATDFTSRFEEDEERRALHRVVDGPCR